jgi:hypothetical protein
MLRGIKVRAAGVVDAVEGAIATRLEICTLGTWEGFIVSCPSFHPTRLK